MSTRQAVEKHREKLRTQLELAVAARRLTENADFKLVIEAGFLRDYVSEQACLTGQLGVSRQQALDNIVGVGVLNHYLNTVENIGVMAQTQLDEIADRGVTAFFSNNTEDPNG